jgi:uroporphyrinogen decarboxylase
MLSRERVIETIRHGKPDRVPIYGWLAANLSQEITNAFGSVAAFEDKYEFDFAHLFGGPPTWDPQVMQDLRTSLGAMPEPAHMADIPMHDPNNIDEYQNIIDQIRHHKEERGRFVYVQTPGFFEAMNGVFGIENHLAYMLIFPDELHELYQRQAEWTKVFLNNCLDLGVDMIHVSDDWGAQNSLMFSPEVWRELVFPYHKQITDAVKQRGAFVSLHTDGNNMSVLDGIVELGYDVVHPFQESAGMEYQVFKSKYMDKFTIMGGLDVQTTIGFGKLDFLKSEIERVLTMFKDGGMLFCTTHFVQNHCSIEELVFAYDTVYEMVRKSS